jgi:copper transport protein
MPSYFALLSRIVVRLLLACCALLGATTMAWSHASLNASQPQDGTVLPVAPKSYALTFSEPVSPLALRLIHPDGTAATLEQFELKDKTLEIVAPGDLGTGTHILAWRVVSEDGHPVGGSVIFSIGEPSAHAPVVEDTAAPVVKAGLWLSKVLLYVGLFFGVGGVFGIRVLMPDIGDDRRAISAVLLLGGIAALSAGGFQGVDALGATGDKFFQPPIWRAGLATTLGWTIGLALVAFVLAGIALSSSSRLAGLTASLALFVAGTSLAASGHASAAHPQWLMRPAVFLHVVTVAVWIGALMPLGLALRRGDPGSLASLKRFSRTIPPVFGVLVVAGSMLATVQVQEFHALIDTAYGNVMLVKLALLLGLFLLVAANRWILTTPTERGDIHATRRMVRSITVETLIALVIFGAVATWRFTPPPRVLAAAAAAPATTHVHTVKAMVDLTVTPGQAGPVDVSAVIMTGEFTALDAKEVTFVFSNPEAGIEPFRRKARKPGDGTWRADAVTLPLPGKWNVRTDILISDFEIVRLNGELTIRHR